MFFGIRAITIKMLAPKNKQKRTIQSEIKTAKQIDEGEAFLRKQAYSDVKINTNESFYDDSDLENTEYFLVLVYHIKTKTPLLSCRYYFDKIAILNAISGDEKQQNINLQISENNNEVFLADRLSGNTSNSIYKRKRDVVFALFYNEIIKNNRNKNLLLMARSDEQERLLTKYLRIGFNVIGNTKHKGVKHWIVFSELNKSYSFLFKQIKLFLFLKASTKGFK